MSNNCLGLELGDNVFANGNLGEVVGVGASSALISLEVTVDGSKKLVQQWYSNDALKKVETGVCPVSTPQVVTEVVEENVKETEKALEFGVPGGSEQKVKTSQKKNKKK
jgi:hypothetical protein